MKKPVKLLIQRADRLGDMVCTLPLIDQIAAQYPHAEIHVLASSRNNALVTGHPLVKKVFTYDVDKGSFRAFFALVKEIRQENYDAYLSVWNNVWMALLGVFANIRVRIGDSSNVTLKVVYTHKVFQDWTNVALHQIDHNLALLRPLYIPSEPMCRHLPLRESSLDQVQKLLVQTLDHHKKVVTVFCHTGGSNLPVSEEVVSAFVDKILAIGKYSVILCGGAAPETGVLVEKTGHDLLNLLTTPLDLEPLKALISLSDIYVGPDTGPTHLASFLNIPLVCYYPLKTTYPTRFGPLSDYQRLIRLDYVIPNVDRMSPQIDAERLYHGFCELVDQLDQQASFNEQEKRFYLMENSLRVLYLVRKKDNLTEVTARIRSLRKEGLMIFPVKVHGALIESLGTIFKQMQLRNVTIIQARRLPFWFRWVVQIMRATAYQTHRAGFVACTLHSYINKRDLLQLYADSLKG